MPSDNQISPLFDNIQPTTSGDAPAEISPIPDKSNSLLDALAGAPSKSSDTPVASAFGDPVQSTTSHPAEDPGMTLPEVTLPEIGTTVSEVASTQTNTPESISAHISEQQKSDIVTQVPSSSDPLIHAIETLIPVPPTPPEQENKTITELDVSPVPALPESHQENSSPEQVEKSDASTGALSLPHDSHQEESDPHLSQYLHADTIYQQMMKIESHEKIRLHLAIKYTLLMFAIFLVFAWIVSNRVIMFGFSEFVWLARIRDGLFALMAGLFALTLWFGSVTWTRHILLISVIRTIALVFFGAVIIALYIPFW